MQNKDLKEKAKFIMAKIREYFEDKVCDFSYEIVDEESKEYDFVIDFTVYNFYAVTIFYYNGKYEFSIVYNNQKIKILDLQEECDDIVLQKLQDELKLRIPDKYLMANSWM